MRGENFTNKTWKKPKCSAEFLVVVVVRDDSATKDGPVHVAAVAWDVAARQVTAVRDRGVEEAPGRFSELVNGSEVEKDVGNGNDVLARREHGECCKKQTKQTRTHCFIYLTWKSYKSKQ